MKQKTEKQKTDGTRADFALSVFFAVFYIIKKTVAFHEVVC